MVPGPVSVKAQSALGVHNKPASPMPQ
jgi:hypothetical protein